MYSGICAFKNVKLNFWAMFYTQHLYIVRCIMRQRKHTTCKLIITWLVSWVSSRSSQRPPHWFLLRYRRHAAEHFHTTLSCQPHKWITVLITSTYECHRSPVSGTEVRPRFFFYYCEMQREKLSIKMLSPLNLRVDCKLWCKHKASISINFREIAWVIFPSTIWTT